MFRIIVCHSCGHLLLARADQRTRRCPHCEARINTRTAKWVASANTAQEASKLIRALKQKRETA